MSNQHYNVAPVVNSFGGSLLMALVDSNPTFKCVVESSLESLKGIVHSWWKTALEGGDLVGLAPSLQNGPMIPFLEMANGKTNRLGCAYHLCSGDSDDDEEEEEQSFLFVCKYGEDLNRFLKMPNNDEI
ncbi:hypothetical protein DICVIV_13525 [Dictyocaulus viviparus]|uniref:SCP domain-containing protein n=1 Tax=Dictyocaulus viviparus TaxID=29172 RepID=A0A0D8X9S0_DICVI|nr:hypothetical protein DICVIV_13525 [Dictyocaulus viviparus]